MLERVAEVMARGDSITGKHRRLRIEKVLEFKETRDRDRRAGIRELSRMSQELGGYDAETK